jgi:release factor glutamine methyltransferase
VADVGALAARLAAAGFVAADEEAVELVERSGGDDDLLDALVARRLTGEPLAWITGTVTFCGRTLRVDPGVYVPRWQTEALAKRAAALLPEDGTAIDLCTGSGAIAAYLKAQHPRAHVLATDLDERAVACARSNGVEAYQGDLFGDLRISADVITAVVPYVPTPDLPLLQRDTFAFETTLSYDGGPHGTAILRRVIAEAREFLRGTLLLELGGHQAQALRGELERLGYGEIRVLRDEEGDARGIECRFPGRAFV